MFPIPSIVLSSGLIGAGALTWVITGRPLTANPNLDVPLNPLGINRSPYGEVFAMAMQGPIDTFYDAASSHGATAPETTSAAAPENPPATLPEKASPTLNARVGSLLSSLDEAFERRTNPKGDSEALKRHLRRQAEDKLRFAYQLDPSHYGNYNSLHFFLTEPAVGTRPELTPSAAKLAEDTIQYCLRQNEDPRPSLTAAAAATNILHLMFSDHLSDAPKYSPAQMRQCLILLDHCLARYTTISQAWDETKHWELLSPQRIAECNERCHFIGKIRDAAEITILRLEASAKTQHSNTPTLQHSKTKKRLSDL